MLKQNDITVLYRDIHGFKKNDCKFIEIKQGPYFNKFYLYLFTDRDKYKVSQFQ